ncbi:MAG TPA: ABC transporter substrate-binding protein [Oligoflexia bacterium]|nr:ABC transporter substrate-binding protein [Oligoflexia bacterium]HMP26758.1 ABC transporter substrate-binding protein [Oligoflexia bacterium]
MLRARYSLFFIILSILSACSSLKDSDKGYSKFTFPLYQLGKVEVNEQEIRYPWEYWKNGKDLDGRSFRSEELVTADSYFFKGHREKAFKNYLEIDPKTLKARENQALILRIASGYLSNGESRKALAIFSDALKQERKDINHINPFYIPVIAYAYGAQRNYNQAIAWLVKLQRFSLVEPELVAENHLKIILRDPTTLELEKLMKEWSKDSFVISALTSERRSRLGSGGEFNQSYGVISDQGDFSSGSTSGDGRNVLVILPLTGKYAALGQSTKRGIDIVFEGSDLTPCYLDLSDDTAEINDKLKSAFDRCKPIAVLGPLLSESAAIVRSRLNGSNIPMLTFSKRSDFKTGENIFRLGATPKSQVGALIDYIFSLRAIKKVGLVFSPESGYDEFADLFKKAVQGSSMEIIFEALSSKTASDETRLVELIDRQAPQALIVFDSLRNASRLLGMLDQRARSRLLVFGPASWDSTEELKQSANLFEGVIFPSLFNAGVASDRGLLFLDSYRKRYRTTPDFLAAQGYDGANIIKQAFSGLPDGSSNGVNALKGVGLVAGVSGPIRVTSSGNIERTYQILQFQGGSIGLPSVESIFAKLRVKSSALSFQDQQEYYSN